MTFEIHPQPKQRKVINLLRQTGENVPTILGFGGARGGAKSRLIRDAALLLALEEPGITIWIFMRNWGKIEENHLAKFRTERPELMAYWSYQRKEFALPAEWGGSRIVLKYADTDDEVRELTTGPEAKYVFIEQAEQFSQFQLQTIKSCNRWTGPGATVGGSKLLMSFNPGGEGTSYLRRIFWLQQFEQDETPGNFAFVQAYGWDNFEWFRNDCPALNWEAFYKIQGECTGSGSEASADHRTCCRFHTFIRFTTEGRKMWAQPESIRMGDLYGRFDVFSGQYFAGVWDERKCTIPAHVADRVIQPWWRRWMGFDWGFGHHSANYWCAAGKLSPKELYEAFGIMRAQTTDVLVVYRELVVNRTPEFELATRIVDMTPAAERREIKRWFVGWDVFSKDRHATNTVAELMEPVAKDAGMPEMERAVIDRVPGWRTLHDCFRRTCALRGENPPDDIGEGPVLLISGNCPALISAIPVLVADPKRLEDVLKLETIEDDVADGFRYAIESFLQAKTQAPVDVRAREAYNSVDDMTAKALRMRVFAEAEKHQAAPQRRFRRG